MTTALWQDLLAWPPPDWLRPGDDLPTAQAARQTGHAGSWCIPPLSRLRRLYQFVAQQCARTDLSALERHNWPIWRVGLEMPVILLLRPQEINSLTLLTPPDKNRRALVYEAKDLSSRWLEAEPREGHRCARQHIPVWWRPRWDEWLARCRAGDRCWQAPEIQLPGGGARDFHLQTEINHLLALAAPGAGWELRDYSLRHVGRTLHREHGLPERLLNEKMTHSTIGTESDNPGRGRASLSEPEAEDDRITLAVARAVGIEP